MEESTTGNLAKILSNIDSAREMEEYLELPEVVNSWQSFPEYFQSLEAVREMDSRNLIRSSGLERSYYYQVRKLSSSRKTRPRVLNIACPCLVPDAGSPKQYIRRQLRKTSF